ncbi:hypothetical protein PHK61_19545 [Actinomycetospora lutea]|uniref:hypothetical protein n=1 Tax=Actinomycetospora lutea TaxID=663604 RepID=UPI00236680FC|nr:hypothetical protein [Actinomycetospora lutea]MDD7940623.1 hypothetical protein [Actinomycetospora lutea]
MTRATERTEVENLLVGIDLQDWPYLNQISRQSSNLDHLHLRVWTIQAEFAELEGRFAMHLDQYPRLRVKRMSLASPWDLVLHQAVAGTPYATAGALGYGVLRGLKYLLELKKEWDTQQRDTAFETLELQQLQLDHAMDSLRKYREVLASEIGVRTPDFDPSEEFPAAQALSEIGPLTEVESIPDDDPRA